jgi:dolichol-phosphate mannosyltransferase
MHQVSVIIPTYREAENLPVLIPRLAGVLQAAGLTAEIVIVDDASDDGTEAVCRELAAVHPVRLIVRQGERGLATAVLRGLAEASGEVVVVMDADLSHPPEKVPELCRLILADQADFVIGSRYVPGGGTDEAWGWLRWLNSRVATCLAWPLTSAHDPMAGFFALGRATYETARANLDPIGYKIGLELIVKCRCRRIAEVPIAFSNRLHGKSKLDWKEQVRYLLHLRRLYAYRIGSLARPMQFLIVGATGAVVDLFAFAALLYALPETTARAVAIWIAMTWNFALNRCLTFEDARGRPLIVQYILFVAACLCGAVINWSVFVALIEFVPFLADHPLLPAAVGILCGAASNYLLSRYIVFK